MKSYLIYAKKSKAEKICIFDSFNTNLLVKKK